MGISTTRLNKLYDSELTRQKSSDNHGILSAKNGGGHEACNDGTEDAADIGNGVISPSNIR